MYVQAIRAGEKSGDLVSVLDHLTGYLASMERVRQRIRAAAAYPIITFAVFILVLSWTLWFVVPRFVGFWDQAGAELPTPTAILVAISRLGTAHPLIPIGVVAALFFLLRGMVSYGPFQEAWGKTVLFLPIVGRLARRLDLARFSLGMGHLLSCRVPLPDAIALTAGTLRNGYARAAAAGLAETVREGHALSRAMEKQFFFPDFYYWAIGEGERREDLGRTFLDLGRHYQRWCEERLVSVGLLIEPLLFLLIGAVVAYIVIALYLPLFRIGGVIR